MLLRLHDALIWVGICAILFISPVILGSITTTTFSILFLLILFTFLIFILRAGLIGRFRLKNSYLEIPLFLLIIYISSQLVINTSNINSKFFYGTLYKYATLNEGIKLVIYFLFFTLLVNMVNSKKDINRLLWVITLTGALISIFGIIQPLSGKDIFGLAGIDVNRSLFSTFMNRNQFAGFVEMVFPLTLSFLCYRIVQVKYIHRPDRKLENKIFLLRLMGNGSIFIFILLTVIFASVFMSLSRTGMALIILGMIIFYIFFQRDKRTFREKRFLLTVLEFIALFAILIIISIELDPILHRFGSFESLRSRLNVDISTLKIILEYPIFGMGRGAFRYIFPKFQAIHPQLFYFTHPNNLYLEYLSEVGVIGLLIFIFGIANFLRKNKLKSDISISKNTFNKFVYYGSLTAIFILGVHSFFGFDVFIPSNAILLFTNIAIFSLSGRLSNGSEGRKFKYIVNINSKKIIFLIILPIYLCFFVGIARFQAGVFLADRMVNNESYDPAHRFRMAVSRDTLNADYKYRLSSILLEQAVNSNNGNREALLDEALKEAEQSVELAPTNANFLYNLSRVLSAKRQPLKAEEFFLKTIKCAPNWYGYRMGYAIFCFNRAYVSKNIGIKKIYLKRGITQYNKAKEIEPRISLEELREYFINFNRQMKEIKKYTFYSRI